VVDSLRMGTRIVSLKGWCKVVLMPDSQFDSDGQSDGQNKRTDYACDHLTTDGDLLMELILENINTTPIGKVLKSIASLPEVRKDKVLDVRRRLSEGQYSLNDRLDIALDKVLEDLTT